jgi:resuscitation-promoting factor RpfA
VTDRQALEAIEASDTDELLRAVDRYCRSKDWEALIELRHRCDEAVSRGKQLWGVSQHIRYRLALEAPGPLAGPVVGEGGSRFALGPLAEVAASTKTWHEMESHIGAGPERDTFGAERVVRGEDIEAAIPDLPSTLLDWEPSYPLATYHPDKVESPSPQVPDTHPVDLGSHPVSIDDDDSVGALGDLVESWTDQSNGRSQISVVEGDHIAAVASLGMPSARVGQLDRAAAMSWMCWAGASGGAHGRRRGAGTGRYSTWFALATLTDLDWPVDPASLEQATAGLTFHWFDDGSPETGWVLRLAISSPEDGLSWSISASDHML